ncbi:helix-turn-helix domain-containing protein [Lysinibacillus sp. Bpr_S20]|uniref:helix-turn-helix domain-containing protein n=1 Tax=Lysinibacillus sp. Bpr_S20 TaxID=2933964 RepID=UPI0020110241|nr:helix-turn-helix domain-containing protein [Lysinibacillus sp. Bpr_S20]MCL1699471.1 helix-turn-helix domain-containing protein [Lysinibacillus sp. Bpr_S20]
MQNTKRQKFVDYLNAYLRALSKKLIRFDSEKELLKNLASIYIEEQKCDAFIVLEKRQFQLSANVHYGVEDEFIEKFSLFITECNPDLFKDSAMFTNETPKTDCAIQQLMEQQGFKTWYTIVIRDHERLYGLCIIGYYKEIKLYEDLRQTITEFGEDLAFALQIAREKNTQQNRNHIMNEWLSKGIAINTSLEEIVVRMLSLMAHSLHVKDGAFYIFSEQESAFYRKGQSLGKYVFAEEIIVNEGNVFSDYFPYLEEVGGDFMSVPLIVNYNVIGVLIAKKEYPNEQFSTEDLQLMQFIAQHGAAMIGNIYLYENEKQTQRKLQKLLQLQQKLVNETIQHDKFTEIAQLISEYLQSPIIICNRFLKTLAHSFADDQLGYQQLLEKAMYFITQPSTQSHWLSIYTKDDMQYIRTYEILDNDGLVGYLMIGHIVQIDEYTQLGIDICLNILSIQFMKQKLIFRAKEQVKDGMINRLLSENFSDENDMMTYANVFNWNVYEPHRMAIVKIKCARNAKGTIIENETARTAIEDLIKSRLKAYNKNFIYSSYEQTLVLIIKADEELKVSDFWEKFYNYMSSIVSMKDKNNEMYLGISNFTNENLESYYKCYMEAKQAVKIAETKQKEPIFFENLGSYLVLHELEKNISTKMYIHQYLGSLLSLKNNKDLLTTLNYYLLNNGNLKETSEQLYIHRSTLQYRLQKIQQVLDIDLSNAETRFDLLLALKMYYLKNC